MLCLKEPHYTLPAPKNWSLWHFLSTKIPCWRGWLYTLPAPKNWSLWHFLSPSSALKFRTERDHFTSYQHLAPLQHQTSVLRGITSHLTSTKTLITLSPFHCPPAKKSSAERDHFTIYQSKNWSLWHDTFSAPPQHRNAILRGHILHLTSTKNISHRHLLSSKIMCWELD